MSGEGDDTKVSSAQHDDTLLAATAPERSSVPTIAPPPDSRYQLGAELGRGGMGRVVEAYDTHLGRTVALKEVLPKAGNIDRRFQREVRITARLEHASIVPLYDSGRLADGRPFYVMRRVTGKPLDDAILKAGTLEGRLALLPNALAAIDAVAHAHKRGVIHRDLKPQNILVGELGETVVIDWGLAKVIGDDDEPVHDSLEPRLPTAADSLQTQVGSVFGTPGFMPPEQARGDELGPSGDVYALGATLYQLIAGKPPFRGTSATDVISSTLRHRLEPIARVCPGAPPEMVTIIEKALAFEQNDRYPHAGALAEDVRRFLTGQLVAAHRYTKRQRVARFARRNRAPLIVGALASVGIAVLAWISVHRILVERDTAAIASVEAQRQRNRADERAAELRDRADQLLLLHARNLLDTNPTQSLAVIKQIEGGGLIRDEATALARAAVIRGVAWGVPTLPELTTSLEMSSDGKRVLQLNRFGLLQVIDLDSKRQIATHKVSYGGNAEWVDHDRRITLHQWSISGDHQIQGPLRTRPTKARQDVEQASLRSAKLC
jgi:serine/threonine protein kinase